jgi:hypothetical protein
VSQSSIPTWQTIFIADAHRDDRKRFVVRADEKLTAFMELESVIASTNTRKSPRRPTKDEKAGRILFVGL